MPGGANATVAATNDWVAVTSGPASYYVFPTPQIALTGSVEDGQDTVMLKCGQNAVQIEPDDLYALMPVLALAAPVGGIAAEEEPSEFRRAMIEGLGLYFAATNDRIRKQELEDDKPVDTDELVWLEKRITQFGRTNVGRRIRYVPKH
jgi:hypothetical protein